MATSQSQSPQSVYADEVSILKRYQSQQLAPGAAQRDIAERLVKARKLLAKHATQLNDASPI